MCVMSVCVCVGGGGGGGGKGRKGKGDESRRVREGKRGATVVGNKRDNL